MASSFNCYNNYYFLLAFLIATLILSISPTLAVDPATQQLIDKICRAMEEYAFCDNTFIQNIDGETADITALTQITVEQGLDNATNTHSFIVQRIGITNDPAEKNALTICENAYHVVMTGFQQAVQSFFARDFQAVLDAERPTARALASCTAIFNTPPNPPNPLADRNRQMRILTAMAVAAGIELTSASRIILVSRKSI